MGFIERKPGNAFILHLYIKPNSIRQEIIDDGDYLKIKLRSKPIQNKANIELLNLLRKKLKILSNQIKIISGLKSPHKTIMINFSKKIEEQEIIKKILS